MLRYEASAADETVICVSAQQHIKKIEANGRTIVTDKNRTLLFKKNAFIFCHGGTDNTKNTENNIYFIVLSGVEE